MANQNDARVIPLGPPPSGMGRPAAAVTGPGLADGPGWAGVRPLEAGASDPRVIPVGAGGGPAFRPLGTGLTPDAARLASILAEILGASSQPRDEVDAAGLREGLRDFLHGIGSAAAAGEDATGRQVLGGRRSTWSGADDDPRFSLAMPGGAGGGDRDVADPFRDVDDDSSGSGLGFGAWDLVSQGGSEPGLTDEEQARFMKWIDQISGVPGAGTAPPDTQGIWGGPPLPPGAQIPRRDRDRTGPGPTDPTVPTPDDIDPGGLRRPDWRGPSRVGDVDPSGEGVAVAAAFARAFDLGARLRANWNPAPQQDPARVNPGRDAPTGAARHMPRMRLADEPERRWHPSPAGLRRFEQLVAALINRTVDPPRPGTGG